MGYSNDSRLEHSQSRCGKRMLLLTMCAALSGAMWAETPITACNFTINTPGTYSLTTDLTCGSGDAIDVRASQVAVKLNGHILSTPGGPAANVGIDIRPTSGRLDHVVIQGPGLIQKFGFGIYITQCDYCQIGLVTSAVNNFKGIGATTDAGAGHENDTVTFLTVGSNQLVGNKQSGLSLGNSTSSVVQYNDASGNGYGVAGGAPGIVLSGPGNTVNNNTANGNLDSGITIGGTASRVYANTTNGNGGKGIVVAGTGNQIFSNVSSVGNAFFDMQDTNLNCDSNTWSNNIFFTRNLNCIH
jgi:parallel beta-helix repeat protein